jgi:mRNA (guanine-N7-)-methyltransferase
MQVEFVASSELGQSKWEEPQQYDAVTCMFAIHYFFVSEAALRQLLENVVSNLKAGMPFQNLLKPLLLVST